MPILENSTHAYQSKLYGEFSQFYDLVFARIFYPRIAAVIRTLDIPPGARVLRWGSAPAWPSARIHRTAR